METSIELPEKAAHIVRFEPQAEMSVVHHMLLYLCTGGAAVRAAAPPPSAGLFWPFSLSSSPRPDSAAASRTLRSLP